MKKERNAVTIVFNKNVCAKDLLQLPENFNGDIIINGKLIIDDDILIKCDTLYANEVYSEAYTVKINGDLYTENIDTYKIEVNGSVYCKGDLYTAEVLVGEDLIVEGQADFNQYQVYVGGDFICEESVIFVDKIQVLGKINIMLCVGNTCMKIEH